MLYQADNNFKLNWRLRSTKFNCAAVSFQITDPSLQNTSGLASTPFLSTHYKTLKARHTLQNHHSHHHHLISLHLSSRSSPSSSLPLTSPPASLLSPPVSPLSSRVRIIRLDSRIGKLLRAFFTQCNLLVRFPGVSPLLQLRARGIVLRVGLLGCGFGFGAGALVLVLALRTVEEKWRGESVCLGH